MAKNLLYLARNPDSVADMGLTFSISTVLSPNITAEVELVPGGKSIPVTGSNVAHFIHRVANFKLNEQIQTSCDAFLSGFYTIVPSAWVRSFNDSELQMLIGGAEGDSRLDPRRLAESCHLCRWLRRIPACPRGTPPHHRQSVERAGRHDQRRAGRFSALRDVVSAPSDPRIRPPASRH